MKQKYCKHITALIVAVEYSGLRDTSVRAFRNRCSGK